MGQAAEHKGNVSKKESFFALLTIYNFVGAVLVKLGVVESFPAFDKELIPERAGVFSQLDQLDQLGKLGKLDQLGQLDQLEQLGQLEQLAQLGQLL